MLPEIPCKADDRQFGNVVGEIFQHFQCSVRCGIIYTDDLIIVAPILLHSVYDPVNHGSNAFFGTVARYHKRNQHHSLPSRNMYNNLHFIISYFLQKVKINTIAVSFGDS